MKLIKFEFSNNGWGLDEVTFGNQNLIVGKNAVGKSKTLNALVLFANFLKSGATINMPPHWCKVHFLKEDGTILSYSYAYRENVIENETLYKNSERILNRDKEHTFIGETEVNPPANKLSVQAQRDTTKNPEFESIMQWAEQLKGFSFSELSTAQSYNVPSLFNEKIDFSEMYDEIHKNEDKKTFVIEKMGELDYDITKIDIIDFAGKYKVVILQENDVKIPLFSSTMSNGMLRVFYIFAYIAYISMEEGAKTLLVDDLGEGLDFSRSKKLSKILFDYCNEHDIQLIATSNDNFLMNAVSLDHWVVLMRKGEITSSISQKTHPDMFTKFKRMGLNNFDLLSTDFIYKYLEKEVKA